MTELALLPMEGRWRVAVVEQAHRLNPDAQNALLKTLEEPVGAACIVLCADDVALLLPTVVSRVARLRLGPVSTEAVGEVLLDHGLDDPARAAQLARASGGRPGLASALASDPASTLAGDRLRRTLLDLTDSDRRSRFAAVAELLADGAALDERLRAGAAPPPDEDTTAPPKRARTSKPAASATRRPAPAERRRAATRAC